MFVVIQKQNSIQMTVYEEEEQEVGTMVAPLSDLPFDLPNNGLGPAPTTEEDGDPRHYVKKKLFTSFLQKIFLGGKLEKAVVLVNKDNVRIGIKAATPDETMIMVQWNNVDNPNMPIIESPHYPIDLPIYEPSLLQKLLNATSSENVSCSIETHPQTNEAVELQINSPSTVAKYRLSRLASFGEYKQFKREPGGDFKVIGKVTIDADFVSQFNAAIATLEKTNKHYAIYIEDGQAYFNIGYSPTGEEHSVALKVVMEPGEHIVENLSAQLYDASLTKEIFNANKGTVGTLYITKLGICVIEFVTEDFDCFYSLSKARSLDSTY